MLTFSGRLRSLLETYGLDTSVYLPVLEPLFSIASTGVSESSVLTPDRQRALAIEALLTVLLESSSRQPVLLVVEDLHWADPSTLEVLGLLLEYLPGLRMLAVFTHRPEFTPPWPIRGQVTSISLSRLPREEVISLAMGVAGGEGLHPSVLEQVVRNANGTPLFIEELATMIVESGVANEPLNNARSESKIAVPKTLRDSFMARLDRLGEAKHVAQIASVLGRDFPRELLAEIAGTSEAELKRSLQILIEAEVLYPRGTQRKQSFVFKHALLQEAAYDSLVKKDRVALHTRVANALVKNEALFAQQPELTGHHFQEAGLYPEAIDSWRRVGINALERSAHQEAIAVLRRALRLQRLLPKGNAANEIELLLLTSLGPSLVATMGFCAEEVGQNYDRAHELCTPGTGSSLLLQALFGVWLYKVVRGDLKAAEEVAKRLVQTGESTGDEDMRLEGYWALGDVEFWKGDLRQAQEHFDKTVALYESGPFNRHARNFGQDPKVAALCYRAFVLICQGQGELAWLTWERAHAWARECKHAFSIGWAMGFPSTMAFLSGDAHKAIRYAEQAMQFYPDQAYPFFATSCQATKAWGLCQLGHPGEALELIRPALAGMRLIGSDLVHPLFSAVLAEAQLETGDVEGALATVRKHLQKQLQMEQRW